MFADIVWITHVDEEELNTEFFEYLGEESVCASVHVVAGDHFVAWFEEFDYGIGGGNAGTEGKAVFAVFDEGKCFFQCLASGVLRAGVFEAFVFSGGGLNVCGGLKDWCHDCAGRRIRFCTRMDEFSSDFHNLLFVNAKMVEIIEVGDVFAYVHDFNT